MKITIKAIKFDLTTSLKNYVEQKFRPLEKIVSRYDAEGGADIRVELRRTTRHHKTGPEVYEAEANLSMPGTLLNAKHDDSDMHVAIDRMKTKLRSEILKFKDKSAPRSRKTGAQARRRMTAK
jgi:ribosomal subunit interface protein